jgi:hypothetical protein
MLAALPRATIPIRIARRRGATAKGEQPAPQAMRAREITEQLIADLWNGRETEDHACVRAPRREADPEA